MDTVIIPAIFCLTIANLFKVTRLALFIKDYEKPDLKTQTQSLAMANILNFIVPFRLGHLFRAWYSGKTMKNGVSFSLATIITEVVVDFFGLIISFILLSLLNIETSNDIIFYTLLFLSSILLISILMLTKKHIKRIILKFASIFNERIELKILKTSWFTIVSLENIVKRVNKTKLLIFTIIIWALNFLTCYILAHNNTLEGGQIFSFLFSKTGIVFHTWPLNLAMLQIGTLICLFTSSFFIHQKETKKNYINLLPHRDANGRLKFLKMYFLNDDNGKYFRTYQKLNSDVAIIEDRSAGSNATTILCNKGDKTFYRKYSFGKDASKLKAQVDWINSHKNNIPLTKIDSIYYEDEICSYDMPFVSGAVTCFNYVHTVPIDEAWEKIKIALDDIDKNLHTLNQHKSNPKTIEEYIESKVEKNINKIEKGQFIKPLLKYDYIYINNKKYHNLKFFKKYLSEENLKKIFSNDFYSDIHGDFTIENIVCIKGKKKNKGYYIIDPNTGNIHDSPFLDYAKLLQSIHGGYEFLMNVKNVDYNTNHIDFLYTKSATYEELYNKILPYLNEKFGKKGLQSIFYHEIIHWLRLMPYKIKKNQERSLIFYAGMIMVMNDTYNMFINKKRGSSK